ncbi:hypothetical protein [Xanthomonas graminis]|uniref:Secreted protein n=1 Tax=Xanthomonas graminis pv. poae TaxID=227946 RepID=A0A199P0F8_9XANT|nr:hypothetical protein [Xanthomonas translucens]OAX54520.1 hypothetical protein A6R73_03290 [Xanthomonas translucens pv. poae]
MRRAIGPLSLWLLCGAVAVSVAAPAADQDPVAQSAETLYRLGEADGTQLAQARYCDLPPAEMSRLAGALQQAARERALAANVTFDAAAHDAAMRAGFDGFRKLMAALEAQGGPQDLAQRQAHYREQCAEVRAGIETLIGPLAKQDTQG